MNTWGEKIKLSIFGESHGEAIGIVIDGLPPGFLIDFSEVEKEMKRRAPGDGKISTARKEADQVEIVSGLMNGRTTGAPLCGLIRNTDTRSGDYSRLPRPGHADYTAFVKYKGFNDYRGGGHFSGRITAPLTFAGSLAKQLLKEKGIVIGSNVRQLGLVKGKSVYDEGVQAETLLFNEEKLTEAMREEILNAKSNESSVGGTVELVALSVPVGLGSPFFGSVESKISSMLFSIPAVKGVEFGRGFSFSSLYGHEANDQLYSEGECIKTYSNNNGGIIGGITNGSPLVASVAIKPTPSISREQKTVDLDTLENTTLRVQGRHDPCIVHRALVVLEGALALCLWDLL